MDIYYNIKHQLPYIKSFNYSNYKINMSNRRDKYFISPNPSTSFVYQSAFMWNSCYKISSQYKIEFSTAIVTVKHKLKTVLLNLHKNNLTKVFGFQIIMIYYYYYYKIHSTK